MAYGGSGLPCLREIYVNRPSRNRPYRRDNRSAAVRHPIRCLFSEPVRNPGFSSLAERPIGNVNISGLGRR